MENLIGKTIVGYRYGKAPECGYSYNYRENKRECGVSMAQVGYYCEYWSFAIAEASSNRKRYYYIGEIAGTGGDDEICLSNVRQITYKEYLKLRKETKDVSNEYVNTLCDNKISLLRNGWFLGFNTTQESVEKMRKQYTRK